MRALGLIHKTVLLFQARDTGCRYWEKFNEVQVEFIHKRTRLTVRLVRDSRGGPARSQEELTLKRERNTKMLAQATLQKLRNAESSLVFMREQHARTLEGLHEEIHKLQKKNARLTFELTMKGPLGAPAGITGCTECLHLEESLTNSKAEILKLRSALTSSEDKIHLLDHQLDELNTKFSEEVQIRDESLSKQNSELDSKANTIATLTQQLYNTKVRLRNELQAKTTAGASSHAAASSGVCVCPHCHTHRKNKPAVTGDRYYALGSDGGVVPVGLGAADYQMSPSIATGAGSSRSRVSRIQRRHFRNSSSPVSQDVRNLSQSESEDGYFSPSKTGTRMLPATPPLTPRPPPTSAASPAPSMIRRASNPMRKQSPSPRSSRGQISGSTSSVTSSRTSVATLTDDSDAISLSTTSVGNNEVAKVLDPVQPHRQGTVPHELRELLKSRENGDLGEQLLISKPPPLPPIVSTDDDDSDQITPTQSEIFHGHYFDPATMTVDPNNLTTVHPSDPLSSSRVKGHHHYHPGGIRQHHRHFILAKAQGLSSAPSTVRLLRYSPPAQQKQDLMMREVQELEVGGAGGSGLLMESTERGVIDKDEERGTAEGTLLVKETIDRKDSGLQELHQR